MNAPTTFPKPHARDKYVPQVETLLPGCTGDELKLRCGLLLSRDYATARLRWCPDEVAPILQHIEFLTTRHAFASMPIEALKALQYQVVMLSAAASGLSDLFMGEPDARG